MVSQFREQTNTMFRLFATMGVRNLALAEHLEDLRTMQHEPLSHWEEKGYVVECRYNTEHRSQLLNVMGACQRRNEAGEDVIMLLHQHEKHAIIMTRSKDSENRDDG